MKYELIINFERSVYPNWKTGDDRLEWYSPYQGMREKLEWAINENHFPRYVTENDKIIETDTFVVAHLIFNTRIGAEEMAQFYTTRPTYIEHQIVERPDL